MTEKPITSLSGDQWLKLIEAEKQKILQIDFAKDIKSYTQGRDSSWMSYEMAAILNQNLPYIPHIIG